MNKNYIYIVALVIALFCSSSIGLIVYLLIPRSTPKEPETPAPTPTLTPTTPTQSPTQQPTPPPWSPPSNMGRDDCYDYGRYWYAAGNPPYCDVSKRVDGQYLPKCNIHPSQRKPAKVVLQWDNFNRSDRWNRDSQASWCTKNNKCFDAKSGSAWCYEPL
jgi:hypothetical protein